MIIKSVGVITIYESLDGDKMVYSHDSGSSTNKMIKEDNSKHHITKWYEWKDILKLASTEPSLYDAIEKAEMIYRLIKKET